MTQYQWQLAPQPAAADAHALSETLGVPPFLATLLLQRGLMIRQIMMRSCTQTLVDCMIHSPCMTWIKPLPGF